MKKYRWMNPFVKHSMVYFPSTDASVDHTFKQVLENDLKYIWERLKTIISLLFKML